MQTIEEMLNPTGQKSETTETPKEKTEESKTETKPEETKVEAATTEEPKPKMVPLKELQEERNKRRLLKAKVEELEKKLAEADTGTVYRPSVSDNAPTKLTADMAYKEDRLIQTVNVIHATRPDATEMLNVFDEAVEQDETLYQRMLNSPDPGTFAYEYAKAIKNQEKYGTNVEEAFKRGMSEAAKRAKEEVYKEIKNKKDIGEKLPKNIASAGVSGSGSETAEWAPKSSKEIWG